MARFLAAVLAVFLFASPALGQEEPPKCVTQSQAIEFLAGNGFILTEDYKGEEMAIVWAGLPPPPAGLMETTTEAMLFVNTAENMAVIVFFVNDCAMSNFGPAPLHLINEALGRTPS